VLWCVLQMQAYIGVDTAVLNGNGSVIGATRISAGEYLVDFARFIKGCSVLVTPASLHIRAWTGQVSGSTATVELYDIENPGLPLHDIPYVPFTVHALC